MGATSTVSGERVTPQRQHLIGGRLRDALDHAGRGWKVLPLHSPAPPFPSARCGCKKGEECSSVGKHPRYHPADLPRGVHSATDDLDLIRRWWERWLEANIGIATGSASGFWVVDVDTRHDGDQTLLELERRHGLLPHTVEA